MRTGAEVEPAIRASSSSVAVSARRSGSVATTVRGTGSRSASGKSSKPTRATDRLAGPSARIAPSARNPVVQNTAVGGSARASRRLRRRLGLLRGPVPQGHDEPLVDSVRRRPASPGGSHAAGARSCSTTARRARRPAGARGRAGARSPSVRRPRCRGRRCRPRRPCSGGPRTPPARRRRPGLLAQEAVVALVGDDHQAGDATPDQLADRLPLDLGVLVDRAEHDGEAGLRRPPRPPPWPGSRRRGSSGRRAAARSSASAAPGAAHGPPRCAGTRARRSPPGPARRSRAVRTRAR